MAYNSEEVIKRTPLKNFGISAVLAPVFFVQLMFGIIVPVLLAFSIVPINAALRFVTYDRVDIRKMMPKLLPFICFKAGKNHNYWVAINTFYFQINEDYRVTIEEKDKRKWYHLCDTSKSTVIIFFMLMINFLLAWAVLVSNTVINDFGPESCDELTNTQIARAVCIKLGTNVGLVNCSTPEGVATGGPLLCFMFLRVSEFTEFLTPLTKAVVVYFIAERAIAIMFEAMRFVYLFHKSRVWAVMVIVAGVFVIAGDAGFVAASLLYFTASFNLIRIYEFLIIGLDIILAGLLLLFSKPLETVSAKNEFLRENQFQELEEEEEDVEEEVQNQRMREEHQETRLICDKEQERQEKEPAKKENNNGLMIVAPWVERETETVVVSLGYASDTSSEGSQDNDL